jgi:hypothetical protein
MTEKHGILDALKHVAFEDDPEPAPKHPPAVHLQPAMAAPAFMPAAEPAFVPAGEPSFAPAAVAVNAPIDAGVVPDNDSVYQMILSKTDFEKTDVAVTIHKYLDPLKAIPDTVMPSNVKFKTAVLQASAQAGLNEDGILEVFDKLAGQLEQEKNTFTGKAQQFAEREVTGRQERIRQISEQITELQQELAKLSNELVDAQGKAAHAEGQFEAAIQRRASEIAQQKMLYTTLLKG